ncbi:MAG: hypothetical protein EP343_20145 [Deltaproteobacteria bacterium]|nr:MAG: hypothetical protein EP343_20145 [Deltaproteobacteria bacterium]
MRQTRRRVSTWWKWTTWLLLGMVALSSSACLNTRGAMFLGKGKVAEYLEKTRGKNPPKGVDFDTYITWRQRMAEMPDGNRILGGFCTDPQVVPVLEAIDDMRTTCQKRLYRDASAANYQGKLFWGFLSATLVAGAGAFALGGGAFAVQDESTKDGLGITAAVFGGLALVAALTNGLGGFDARQERHKIEARRVDNYMWSLRQRVTVQVCNAKSRGAAVQQIVYIYKLTQQYCTRAKVGDGYYTVPTKRSKFDSMQLPPAPLPRIPPRVRPPEIQVPPAERSSAPPVRREPPTKSQPPAKRDDNKNEPSQDDSQKESSQDDPNNNEPAKPEPSKPQ